MSLKITINDEEVVSNSNLQIKEEMLSTSSTILKNCYPKSWEEDKDYVSRYYFPKDYSKCKITDVTEYPEDPGITVKGTNLNINYDNSKNWELKGLFGDTLQDGTPTPSSPVPIQSVTGLQNINIKGKNLFSSNYISSGQATINDEERNDFTISKRWANNMVINDNVLKIFEPGTQYTLSAKFKILSKPSSFGSNNRNRIFGLYNGGTITDIMSSSLKNTGELNTEYSCSTTFTTPSDLTNYRILSYCYKDEDNVTQGEIEIIELQIEKGSSATSFEPYTETTYEVNLGKNLLDASKGRLGTFNNLTISYSNGEILLNGTSNAIVDFYVGTNVSTPTYNKELLDYMNSHLGDYTLSNNLGFENYFRIGGSYPQNTGTTTSTNKVDLIFVRIPAGTYNNQVLNIQLELGSQATSYSPYFTPIELNKIGDYQDRIYKDNGKWYLEKHTQRIVINENTPGIYQSGNLTNTMRMAVPSGYTLISNTTAMYCDKLQVYASYNGDYEKIYLTNNNFYIFINKSRGVTNVTTFKTWLSTNNLICYVVLATPTYTEITNEELIEQLETICQSQLYNGINNISVNSENLPSPLEIHYNFNEEYTTEDLIFCGCIKNTGRISLNPREPHYCDLQILDFKTLLSEGDCLNYVISNKTISEAINQVVSSISDYGFVVGNIQLLNPDEIIGAYSTLNKTAYDVFQYFADITQSRWTTRMIDENAIAIDFYDPTLMPVGTEIKSTTQFYEDNNIVDISFNYSTNDYRNKQIMTSDEVFANITQTQTIIADGYTKNFMCENKIGLITNITLNGVEQSFITKNEEKLGYSGDFIYQPGENTFISSNTISAGGIIVITYYPIVKGREIILNSNESGRIETQIGRRGVISRYENRNDSTSSQELQKIGQSYIKYKGQAEITLKVVSTKNIWNIGQIVNYNAPLEELTTDYMVKSKSIDMYLIAGKIFYTYELTSNFNYENAVNYFDNQRAKNQGNIGEGETITRNIDLESTALIKFYDTAIEEIQVQNPTSLDFALDGVLI